MKKEDIKIIIVEDEAMIAMDIEEKLNDNGFNVLKIVDNGADAIKYAGKLKPDFILMDIVIKGDMDGIETSQKIKELYDIPIVFLTAYDNPDIVKRASEIQPLGFLIKPFDDSRLQKEILDLFIHQAVNLACS